jgi:hypothetical protein
MMLIIRLLIIVSILDIFSILFRICGSISRRMFCDSRLVCGRIGIKNVNRFIRAWGRFR